MVSHSADVGASVAAPTLAAFDTIVPGVYHLVNVKTETQLRSYKKGEGIFVTKTREFPGLFAQWTVERPNGSNEFKISNVGLSAPTFVGSEDQVVSDISREGIFIISVPNRDTVWAVNNLNPEQVRMRVMVSKANGSPEQLWKFVRVKA
ncbi:hypothetical protein FB451DRAFT_1230898 [Mycena latifolia]|nr:hypothetical protein FB451DRAFT_1230898 [Mycena latifolia]